ncbi:MAG: hypothetical protein NZM38_04190 [Cytophagales bacterium]|nr:hypothetical protein [Cytophagales bacterium]MDW8383951.1 hypothetical protein [Flammeovirgaceae bacterium]
MKYYVRIIVFFLWNVSYSEPFSSRSLGELQREIISFVRQELLASLKELKEPTHFPNEMFGLPVGGSFTWASWASTLGRYVQLSESFYLEEFYLPTWIQNHLLQEAKEGKTFAQLYAAELFWKFRQHTQHAEHILLKDFDEQTKQKLIDFTDVRRYLSEDSLKMVYPANYYAVAALTMAYRTALGWEQNSIFVHRILDTCVRILQKNGGFLDDDKQGRGRYDRYLHEFIRFTYQAAKIIGYSAAIEQMKPMLKKTAQLWWDTFSPITFHSSPYGRSLQNVWEDTWEQSAFFIKNPDFSPTSPQNLLAVFQKSYEYYRKHEYDEEKHINRMLDSGRATYAYAGRDRIWQYSIGALGKLALSLQEIVTSLDTATQIRNPTFSKVNKWYEFRKKPSPMGLWAYRCRNRYFVIPVVGSFGEAPVSDYQHIPYGLPYLAIPVNQKVPNLMPYLKIQDSVFTFGNEGVAFIKKRSKKLRLYYSDAYEVTNGYLSSRGISSEVTYTIRNRFLQTCIVFRNVSHHAVVVDSLWCIFPFFTSNIIASQHGLLQTNFTLQDKKLVLRTSFVPQIRLISPSTLSLQRGAFTSINKIVEVSGEKIRLNSRQKIVLLWNYEL